MASRRQRVAGLFLLELFHWCPVSQTVDLQSHTDLIFIKEIVDMHNKYRSQVKPSAAKMLYMSWDKKLAEIAHDWAKGCKYEPNPALKRGGLHPSFPKLGENLWTGTESDFEPIKGWMQSGDYDVVWNRCVRGITCDRHNQVIWGNTYRVGCAAQHCLKIEGLGNDLFNVLFVCVYGPAGSYYEKPPYIPGTSCSECPAGDACLNKLCRNEKRDQEPVYWGPSTPVSESTSKPVSVRPSKPGSGRPSKPVSGGSSTRKLSIWNTLQAYYGDTAFVTLHCHMCVFTLTHFMA